MRILWGRMVECWITVALFISAIHGSDSTPKNVQRFVKEKSRSFVEGRMQVVMAPSTGEQDALGVAILKCVSRQIRT
jgi:hypothetical protein